MINLVAGTGEMAFVNGILLLFIHQQSASEKFMLRSFPVTWYFLQGSR